MYRLYLTDEQADSVKRALKHQIKELHKCAKEMRNDNAYGIEGKYMYEANTLQSVINIFDYSTRK